MDIAQGMEHYLTAHMSLSVYVIMIRKEDAKTTWINAEIATYSDEDIDGDIVTVVRPASSSEEITFFSSADKARKELEHLRHGAVSEFGSQLFIAEIKFEDLGPSYGYNKAEIDKVEFFKVMV